MGPDVRLTLEPQFQGLGTKFAAARCAFHTLTFVDTIFLQAKCYAVQLTQRQICLLCLVAGSTSDTRKEKVEKYRAKALVLLSSLHGALAIAVAHVDMSRRTCAPS